MKKLSLVLAISLGLAACAEKESDYARRLREQKASRSEGTVTPAGAGVDLCEKPEEAVCGLKPTPIAESLKKEGRQKALEALRKKHDLPESFDGTDEAFYGLGEGARKYQLRREFLQMADAEYRSIYDYDADVQEAGDMAVQLMIKDLEKQDLNETDKRRLIAALNTTVIKSVRAAFNQSYDGKDITLIRLVGACGADGLGLIAESFIPSGSAHGVVTICPGLLLLNAGKSKSERIASLIMLLGHELSHQLEFQGAKVDYKVRSCLGARESQERETQADLWGAKVLNAYLASEKNSDVKKNLAMQALNWMCHMSHNSGGAI